MLTFSTTQIIAFKTSMEVIDSLVSDVNFEVSTAGIRVRETNRTNKLFISVNFDADNFDTFECLETFNVGIELAILVNILKPNLQYDNLTFVILEDLKTAKLTLESFNRKEIKTVKIPLLVGLSNTSGCIEESRYTHSVIMNSDLLSKYCKDIARTNLKIKLKLNRKELVLSSEDESIEYQIVGGHTGANALTITTEERSKVAANVILTLKYILLACKCSMISELVTIFLDKGERPPTIRFCLGSLGILNLILF
jgi:DNA polymerase III sliding clamp (beta) subunit (PCNA family)